jgi:ABC-2 type transport system permease protein
MNTQSNTLPESHAGSARIASAILPAPRTISWSLQRELWENRSIYIAPMAVAAVFLFGFLISTFNLPHSIQAALALDPAKQRAAIQHPFAIAAGFLMATQVLVGIFYSLDALHGERRDRSILFWKSLPVSDLTTVLTKAAIPIAFLPLFTFFLTLATQLLMLLLSGIVLLGHGLGPGQSLGALWTQLSWLPMSLGLLYHLLTVHALWHAPLYGWLLLVSGWARRMAFVWVVLPPLAIGIIEKIAFNTSHFATLVAQRLSGPEVYSFTLPDSIPMHPGMTMSLANFLSTPGLWLGLALTAVFLAAAVRLRRYRGPI